MITESMEKLRKFTLFSDFTDEQCIHIKKKANQIHVPAQKLLLKRGTKLNTIFVLLKGDIMLKAKDGTEKIIRADSKAATNAIARIRPCLYDVSSLTQIRIIVLTEKILNDAASIKIVGKSNIEKKNTSTISPPRKITKDQIIGNITHLLYNDQLLLPSMPDIALKIRKAFENDDSDLNDIIKTINLDQSIAIKLINTANSAMYNTSGKKIENSKMACARLGSKMVMNLVFSYAMKEIFTTNSPLFKNKMSEIWQHSVKVAAISSILARLTPGFDAEKALLSGLLHNIGSVVILNYLSEEHIKIGNPKLLDDVLLALQAEVGETLLKKWAFSNDLVNVVKYSTDLFHDDYERADYIDFVNIAQIHAYIGTPEQQKLPIINQIPAFKKLALGQLTPELSIKILIKSQAEIDQTISLFS